MVNQVKRWNRRKPEHRNPAVLFWWVRVQALERGLVVPSSVSALAAMQDALPAVEAAQRRLAVDLLPELVTLIENRSLTKRNLVRVLWIVLPLVQVFQLDRHGNVAISRLAPELIAEVRT
jgi:hypothetical protein